MSVKLIDNMEYSSDANAQAAYVTNAVNTGADDSLSKLLIHFDGADGATTYTAETGQTVTFVGTAQLDTAQYKFGASSLLLDGNSDYVTVPNSADFDMGSGDFTVDAWIRFSALTTSRTIYSNIGSAWGKGFAFGWHPSLGLYITDGSNPNRVAAWSPSLDTWYHVALVRSGSYFKFFVDGSQVGSDGAAWNPGNSDLLAVVGSYRNIDSSTYVEFFNGWIDEVRISKGIARWTSNFTPQTWNYMPLQCGSEATIKTQGSYALKGVATTSALNKTLTRTVSPTIDLSGLKTVKFNIRSNRTGSNIKVGFHDSGGTTIESTPNVTSANEFQTVTVDISAVSDANKDAIDSIIITQVNADSSTTWYIDNMYALNQHKRIILL